jgi:hypothetical protein
MSTEKEVNSYPLSDNRSISEPVTVGLSDEANATLKTLKGMGFVEELDAYRFAVALAIAHGVDPSAVQTGKRTTKYNVGTLDPERSLYSAVRILQTSTTDLPVYTTIERLAEWGIRELGKRALTGYPFSEIVSELETLSPSAEKT